MWLALLLGTFFAVAQSTAGQLNVTTYQYNNQRTGVNANEAVLNPSNVNVTDFGELFTQPVDGYVYAQPLYVSGVTINGAVHNVVYVTTEHDSVFAFDADSNTGSNAQPLWQTSFLSPGVTSVPSSSIPVGTSITPEVGITATPVIDLSTNTLYVVAETLEDNGTSFVHRLHALDITTGAEKPGSPIEISASVTVPGQSAVTFYTSGELSRPGLLLYKGVVYVAFGSQSDGTQSIRGWILGYQYNGSSFSQVFVFCPEPSSVNGWGGGIWMGGQGLMMDTGSNLLVTTGNGEFDTDITPPLDWGDSILRIDLSQGPTVQDYFTPMNQATLAANDQDQGSGGMAMLFNQSGAYPDLLVQDGKVSPIFVVNRDNMGQYSASSNNVVQEIDSQVPPGVFTSPVYFNGNLYYWGVNDYLRAYSVTNGTLSNGPVDESPNTIGFPGATPTISANGTSNGILWALDEEAYKSNGPAVLYAWDPNQLSTGPLYTSAQNSTRDNPGGAVEFAVPVVVNGKVYVGGEGQLSVYGELAQQVATPQISPASESFSGSISVSITDATAGATIYYTTDGSTPPTSPTSVAYTEPFTVTKSTTVNAAATESGYTNSSVATAAYTYTAAVPVITSPSSANGTVGTNFSYQITATNSPTSYGATGLPRGLSCSRQTGLIQGRPDAAGTSTIGLSATNSNGTGTATLTLTVTMAAPVITSSTTASGTVGTSFSYQITATNSPTSYGATGLPPGLSLNNSTGLISGTPTKSGKYPVTLTATNANGTGTKSLHLTIAQ